MSSRRFHVEYTPLAVENLRALPKSVRTQVIRKISRLESGLMGNIKKLRQADFGYRLRMGDYRILFDVEDDTIVIQK
jgi:mRNA interferase RelE/StbE